VWETQLSNDERRLLAAIAHGDEGARRVLADLWQQVKTSRAGP